MESLSSTAAGQEPPIAMVAGLPFHLLNKEEAVEECLRLMEWDATHYIVTANSDFIAQSSKNEELRDIIFHADRIFADGMPIVWLSHLFKYPLPARVTGADLILPLLQGCEDQNKSVYFFGAEPEVQDHLRTYLKEHYPSLKIAGMASPPVGTIDSWDNEAYSADIRAAQPDLLFVALGCPKQETWIHRFYQQTGVPLSIGVGASLDFIVGRQIRAPKAIQKMGMEWLWRLSANPSRLFKRYVHDFFTLSELTLKQWIAQNMKTDTSLKESNLVNPCLGDWELVILSGDVDASKVSNIQDPEIESKPVVIECSAVTFLDSSGLGKLIQWARRAKAVQQPICLLNPSRAVSFLIESVNLQEQFPSAKTVWGISAILKKSKDETSAHKTKTPFRILPNDEAMDATTVGDLEQTVLEVARKAPQNQVIEMDMSRVTMIDSYAIGRFINMKRRLWQQKNDLVLVDMSKTVHDVLRLLRLDQILTTGGDVESLPNPNQIKTRGPFNSDLSLKGHRRTA